ncbi:hypothetical protein HGG70_05150 [Rhodobacteraceae bacterium R_SAG4]|nr:hypothetical protein [Rhodobacteraceae bacterium R_SAG4]
MNGLSATETRIINKVISNIEALCKEHPNSVVFVHDEEGLVYKGPFDKSAIRNQIGHTEITTLALRIGGKRGALIEFVHGNEEDVISNGIWAPEHQWVHEAMCKGTEQ